MLNIRDREFSYKQSSDNPLRPDDSYHAVLIFIPTIYLSSINLKNSRYK